MGQRRLDNGPLQVKETLHLYVLYSHFQVEDAKADLQLEEEVVVEGERRPPSGAAEEEEEAAAAL